MMEEFFSRLREAWNVLWSCRCHFPHFDVKVGLATDTTTGKTRHVLVKKGIIYMFDLKDTDKVTVTIAPKDAKNKPAKVDGVPVWAVDAANVVAITPSADGLSCILTAGDPGTARVSVEADADLGPGVQTLGGFIDISVIPGTAVTIDLTPGTPTPQ